MLTLFPDPSPKSAKISNTISRMLWSRDRFYSNKMLQMLTLGLTIIIASLVEVALIYDE